MVKALDFSPSEPWFDSCCHAHQSSVASGRASGQNCAPCARKIPFTRGHQLAFVTMQCARRQKFVCDGSTSDIATLNAVLSLSRLTGCNTERLSVKYDEYDLLCIEKARCIFRGADKHFNCVNYT